MVAVSDEISARVKQICKNVQNTNQIKEVLEELKTGDAEIIEESIDILFGVFSYHIVKKTWLETGEDQEKKDETALAKDIISSWLKTNFEYFLTILVSKINAVTSATQCTIFDKFLKLVSLENDHFWKGEFDVERKLLTRFDVLFNQLLDTNFTEELAGYMNELMENLDIQFLLIKKVHEVCASKNEDSSTSGLTSLGVDNCLKFLQLVSMNHINVKEDEAVLYFVKNDEFIRKNYRRSVEQAWLAFLRVENMSPVLRKKTLVDMDTKIIPFLSNPKILIDFLTDSYNAGGVTSLLALNGLFVLINEHNLDYPDFYTNLYKIIDASIFHMKYKSRFFHYIDMFLTSTHLPVYLIAAFIKKFSRMLLFTPSTDVLMVLTLIKNLLIRHTSTRILIHRKKTGDQTVKNDPYIYDEPNPAECQAIKSSLWELGTLSSHFSSDVKTMVASFKKDFPDTENDMTEHFDCSYEDLFKMKIDKLSGSIEEAPTNFTKAKELFDTDSEMWAIE